MSLGNYFSYKYHQIVENGEFLITHIPSTLISSLIIPLYFPTFLHTQPFTYTFNNYYSSTQQKLRMSLLGTRFCVRCRIYIYSQRGKHLIFRKKKSKLREVKQLTRYQRCQVAEWE